MKKEELAPRKVLQEAYKDAETAGLGGDVFDLDNNIYAVISTGSSFGRDFFAVCFAVARESRPGRFHARPIIKENRLFYSRKEAKDYIAEKKRSLNTPGALANFCG